MTWGATATSAIQVSQKENASVYQEPEIEVGRLLAGSSPASARRGHAQPALKIGDVTQRYQLGAVLGGDHGRGIVYPRVGDHKQGCEFFEAEFIEIHHTDSSRNNGRKSKTPHAAH
jgi:hypothetical protein